MGTKSKIKEYIKTWQQRCYSDGVPDVAPQEIDHLVPSYKNICITIMKNDTHLELLGFTRPVSKFYSELKKIELIERGIIKSSTQLKMFI